MLDTAHCLHTSSSYLLYPFCCVHYSLFVLFFFFNDTATTEIYTLSLHDALPICFGVITSHSIFYHEVMIESRVVGRLRFKDRKSGSAGMPRRISYAVLCLKKKKRCLKEATIQ